MNSREARVMNRIIKLDYYYFLKRIVSCYRLLFLSLLLLAAA